MARSNRSTLRRSSSSRRSRPQLEASSDITIVVAVDGEIEMTDVPCIEAIAKQTSGIALLVEPILREGIAHLAGSALSTGYHPETASDWHGIISYIQESGLTVEVCYLISSPGGSAYVLEYWTEVNKILKARGVRTTGHINCQAGSTAGFMATDCDSIGMVKDSPLTLHSASEYEWRRKKDGSFKRRRIRTIQEWRPDFQERICEAVLRHAPETRERNSVVGRLRNGGIGNQDNVQLSFNPSRVACGYTGVPLKGSRTITAHGKKAAVRKGVEGILGRRMGSLPPTSIARSFWDASLTVQPPAPILPVRVFYVDYGDGMAGLYGSDGYRDDTDGYGY